MSIRKTRVGSLVTWRVRRGTEVVAQGQLLGWFTEQSARDCAERASAGHCRGGDAIEVCLGSSPLGEIVVTERAG